MISREPTPTERDEIAELMLAARLLRPYYGRALAALRWRVVDGLGTVAIDYSWRLYADLEWLRGLSPVERATVIAAHEVEHVLRGHDRMRGLAPARVVNIAGDAEINDDIHDRERLPPGGVTPSVLGCADHLLAEDYLRALLDGATAVPCCGGGSGATGHVEEYEEPADGMTEPEAEAIRDAVAADVREHVATHGRGSVPAGVEVWADARAPRVAPRDWRRELGPVVARLGRQATRGRDEVDLRRLSRRWRQGDPLRYARTSPRPRVGIAVDTSGSMLSLPVIAHVVSVARSVGDVRVAQGDVGLSASVSDRVPRRWYGGGGTDLRPLIAALVPVCDVIVVVTDGDTPWPSTAPTVPLVVVLIGGGACPEWARVVMVDA